MICISISKYGIPYHKNTKRNYCPITFKCFTERRPLQLKENLHAYNIVWELQKIAYNNTFIKITGQSTAYQTCGWTHWLNCRNRRKLATKQHKFINFPKKYPIECYPLASPSFYPYTSHCITSNNFYQWNCMHFGVTVVCILLRKSMLFSMLFNPTKK